MKKITVLNLFVWSMIAFIPGTALSESDAYHLGGVVEVEAGFVNEDDSAMGDSSDIALATVEIGLDAKLNKNVEAQIVLLYEDGEDFTVDEGTITLTGPYGEFITAGKMYVPFGMFNSHFISDPLTLELGETNESAILIGYGNDVFDVSLFPPQSLLNKGKFTGGAPAQGVTWAGEIISRKDQPRTQRTWFW